MTELTEGDKKLLNDIDQYGCHVVKIMEDEQGPGFCYSVGIFKTFNHPEILIIGLKLDLAHVLINNIVEFIKEGKRYDSSIAHNDIIEGFKCYMVEVDESYYKEYLGYALWYYKGSNFPILQCVYPTVNGVYPWQKEWPEKIINLQPILGNIDELKGI